MKMTQMFLVALALVPGSAFARTIEMDAPRDPWTFDCASPERSCRLTQTNFADASGPATLAISKSDRGLRIEVETPPLAGPSVVLAVGESEDLIFENESCADSRCHFEITLDYKASLRFRRAHALTLILTPEGRDTRRLTFAMAQLEENLRRLPEDL